MLHVIHPNRWLIWTIAIILMVFIVLMGAIQYFMVEQEQNFPTWHPITKSASKLAVDRVNLKTYQNVTLGYTLRFPSDWQVLSYSNGFAIKNVSTYKAGEEFCKTFCKFPDDVYLFVYSFQYSGLPFDSIFPAFKEERVGDFSVIEAPPLTPDTYYAPNQKDFYVVRNDNYLIKFSMVYGNEAEALAYKTVKEVIASLAFFEPSQLLSLGGGVYTNEEAGMAISYPNWTVEKGYWGLKAFYNYPPDDIKPVWKSKESFFQENQMALDVSFRSKDPGQSTEDIARSLVYHNTSLRSSSVTRYEIPEPAYEVLTSYEGDLYSWVAPRRIVVERSPTLVVIFGVQYSPDMTTKARDLQDQMVLSLQRIDIPYVNGVNESYPDILKILPKNATVVDVESLVKNGVEDRTLVFWIQDAKMNPMFSDVYACPHYERGSYYSGSAFVTLIDSKDNAIVNTLHIDRNPGVSYKILQGFWSGYSEPGKSDEDPIHPKILWLNDYNGDGKALEFALYDQQACMGKLTTLIGYSAKQDKVIQYQVDGDYWADYLFARVPQKWPVESTIDYSGRG